MPCQSCSIPVETGKERRLKKDLDHVTRMLCSVLKLLEQLEDEYNDPIVSRMPANVSIWWEFHKEEDRKRKARAARAAAELRKTKKLQKQALDKLSPEEKKALGVKE